MALDSQDMDNKFGHRDISDIIISCFATIFACTWSAVHPNIPSPWDSWWDCFKRQFVTMLYALMAPEAMTAWALRQHLAAWKIVNNFNRWMAKGEFVGLRGSRFKQLIIL